MTGVGLFAGGAPLVPKGSERFTSYLGLPRFSTVNWWRKKENNGQPTVTNGATITINNARSAVTGATLNRVGATNAAPCYQTLDLLEEFALPIPGQAFGAIYPEEAQLYIFAETIQVSASGALPNGHALIHGFSLVGNLNAAFPLFDAATSWRGIAAYQRTTGGVTSHGVAIKGPGAAALYPIATLDMGNRVTLEHRLYAPTASRAARYQLLVNESLAIELDGTNTDWPIPTVAADASWRPCPMALNNPGGAVTVTMRAWNSRIILGPDSPGTY
jgi:hypothetical protein